MALIPGFHASTGLAVMLIIPDRLNHSKATHASNRRFLYSVTLGTQRDELLLMITHR